MKMCLIDILYINTNVSKCPYFTKQQDNFMLISPLRKLLNLNPKFELFDFMLN